MRKQLTMIVCVALAASVATADWPQFLGSTRDGKSAETNLARAWPAGGPRALWSAKLAAGFGGACVVGEDVYVLDRDDRDDVLRCLSLADGSERWAFRYAAPGRVSYAGPRTTPAADAKHVFVTGPFGHLHCLARATGKVIWKKNLLKDYETPDPRYGFTQSPLLVDDLVICAPSSEVVGVVAFEKTTGKEKWRSKPIGALGYASPFVTTLGGVRQVVMLAGFITETFVTGVDLATGKVLWKYTGPGCKRPIPNVTPIGDGRFFFTGGYDSGSVMFKVDAVGGKFAVKELFRLPGYGSQMAQPVCHGGHLYLNTYTNSKRADGLACFDLSGKLKWKTGTAPSFGRGNCMFANGMIYMIDGRDGTLRLIETNPAKYTELASAQVLSGKNVWAPLAISGGKLLVRDARQIKCVDVTAK